MFYVGKKQETKKRGPAASAKAPVFMLNPAKFGEVYMGVRNPNRDNIRSQEPGRETGRMTLVTADRPE